jgi:hypothetical protein
MHKKNFEIFHQGWLVKSPPNPRGIFRAVSCTIHFLFLESPYGISKIFVIMFWLTHSIFVRISLTCCLNWSYETIEMCKNVIRSLWNIIAVNHFLYFADGENFQSSQTGFNQTSCYIFALQKIVVQVEASLKIILCDEISVLFQISKSSYENQKATVPDPTDWRHKRKLIFARAPSLITFPYKHRKNCFFY